MLMGFYMEVLILGVRVKPLIVADGLMQAGLANGPQHNAYM